MKKMIIAPLLCALALAGCSAFGGSSDDSSSQTESFNLSTDSEAADEFVDRYMQKMKNKAPAEEVFCDVFTEEFIDKLKDSGQWEMTKQTIESTYPYITDVSSKRTGILTENQLRGAELVYKTITGESVEILSGYSYDYTTYLEINGESSNIPSELCAIYLVDDGWKVLNSSPKSLG